MASINDLDNPLLLLILNRLSIRKLFTAGHVCVRWNAIRTTSAAARKELILMVGNDAKRYIDESGFQIPEQNELVNENGDAMFPDQSDVQLKIHSFPLEFSRFLCVHFTNLTSLTISTQIDIKDLNSIIHLLEQFNRPNGTLQSLKLYSNHKEPNTELNKNRNIRPYLRLLSAVNSIGSLRKLTFDVNAKFAKNSKTPQIHLPILAQLEVFEFNSADDQFFCLHDSITRYAMKNQGLRRIGIHIQTPDVSKLLALPTELSFRFTHLNLVLYFATLERLADLCGHFPNLTSLKITIRTWNYTIFSLLHTLAHLTHLISLVINIEDGEIRRVLDRDARGIQFELPYLKVLTVIYLGWHNTHQFFDKCKMNLILPNVQVVRTICERSICNACHMELIYGYETLAQLEEHCARHMFHNFANSQHLRMVRSINAQGYTDYLGPRDRQWKWNEIGPFEEEDEDTEDDEEDNEEYSEEDSEDDNED